jgi:hypothetical protein
MGFDLVAITEVGFHVEATPGIALEITLKRCAKCEHVRHQDPTTLGRYIRARAELARLLAGEKLRPGGSEQPCPGYAPAVVERMARA